jgi:acetyl esterase/lipase
MIDSSCGSLREPITILLWPEGAPGAVGDEETDKPSLTIYLPDPQKATGAGVVVCPGGGYCAVCNMHEGKDIAEWFRGMGVAAFVLKYRIAPRYNHPAPLLDAQRAVRTARAMSAEWGVDPSRIGIMGFSAGGHLASSAGTIFDGGCPSSADPIDRQSSRPDFMILCYSVISMVPPFAHVGSRANLLGGSPDPQVMEELSTEKRVTPQTPPTFLMHTDSDNVVMAENSAVFYLALRKAGVPAEMHIYAKGPHGVGLAQADPVLSFWPKHLQMWMEGRGLLG